MRAAHVAALCAFAFVSSGTTDAAAACRAMNPRAADRLSAEAVADRLQRQGAVELDGKLLDGDLVLDAGSIVGKPFRCRGCVIDGDLVAEDVDFERTVDLSGTTVAGHVRLARARFDGLALFDSLPDRTTTFKGPVDFAQTRFVEGASFREAVFRAPLRFNSVRALDEVSFTDACFDAGADFEATTFAGDTSFQASSPDLAFRRAAFEEARFVADADFRGRSFTDEADFSRTSFSGKTDLSRTRFAGVARFDEARFGGATSFLAATFDDLATFVDAAADASVDFTAARFLGDAKLFDFTSNGLLTLDGRNLGGKLVVSDDTTVGDAHIVDFGGMLTALRRYGDHDHVERFLALIESSAKARDDLALANEARYERRKLAAEDYPRPRWLVDYVFYRGVAVYLVRPLHPIATLLLVALVFAAARRYRVGRVWRSRRNDTRPTRLRRLVRAAAAETLALAGDAVGRLRLIGKADAGSDPAGEGAETTSIAGGRGRSTWVSGVERWTYRVLLAVAALALANSNPTLRQMFDALV